MNRIFYRGKLTPIVKSVMISNNIIAMINGRAADKEAMKNRIKAGYEGDYSDDVNRYDELCLEHYNILAENLIKKDTDCRNKTAIDAGCGTGVLAGLLLERGASRVACIDFSNRMLELCRNKFDKIKSSSVRIVYKQADIMDLPFDDNSFDLAVSGMVLGLTTDHQKFISELHRVLKPGGHIAVSTHGPEWYYEIVETSSRFLLMNYLLQAFGSTGGIEFWPLTERMARNIMKKAGFSDITVRRYKETMNFNSGGESWDFFAACSTAWFLEVVDPDERKDAFNRIRDYFVRKKVTRVTYDALMLNAVKK